MILTTQRTIIRKAKLEDVSFIYQLLNQASFKHFIGDRGINTLADAKAYIENAFFDSYAMWDCQSPFVVTDHEHNPVGVCGFYHRPAIQIPDLGFAFLTQYEGKGLAFEAANSLCQCLMHDHGVHEIGAILMPSNVRSKALLNRLGFKESGLIIINPDQQPTLLMTKRN
ncbi:Acetyltransferase, GNAT family [Pseudoalteromonas luteoviolacea B = ATCC 29581]|nr:Acetyltransferase, GNAT family [Pseudoalteromonas luteoviolacea B = ATCC 29581]